MLNLKVSKQARIEASKNKVSNKFSNITKKHITKKSRNSKLKEKCYINKTTHLATEKKFVLHHSLKINKRGKS